MGKLCISKYALCMEHLAPDMFIVELQSATMSIGITITVFALTWKILYGIGTAVMGTRWIHLVANTGCVDTAGK